MCPPQAKIQKKNGASITADTTTTGGQEGGREDTREGREGKGEGREDNKASRTSLPCHPPTSATSPPALPWMKRSRSRSLKAAGRTGGGVMPSPAEARRVPRLSQHLLLATNGSANFSRGTLAPHSPPTPHLPSPWVCLPCYSCRPAHAHPPTTSMPSPPARDQRLAAPASLHGRSFTTATCHVRHFRSLVCAAGTHHGRRMCTLEDWHAHDMYIPGY